MRFSIVTVTYNNLDGLRKTAESVLRQRLAEYEWVIIDGGSCDGTREFLARLDCPKLRWISEKDAGIYDAMNKGIALATGDYCVFMNAGDLFFDETVLHVVEGKLASTQPTVAYGDAYEVSGDRRWYKPARHPILNAYAMFTHHQSIFYERRSLGNGYDLSYRYSSDWALTTRLLRERRTTVLHVDSPICLFERGGISQSQQHRRTINIEHWRILTREAKFNTFMAMLLWCAKVGVNKLRRYFPKIYDAIRYPSLARVRSTSKHHL